MKRLLPLLTIFTLITAKCFAQSINTTVLPSTGRFISCPTPANIVPVITTTFLSGTGSSVQGGNLVITDPCETTVIRVAVSNLHWSKNPGINWIHSFYFPLVAAVQSVSPSLSPASWVYMPNGCTGTCPGGISAVRGFYFRGPGQICCPLGPTTPDPCDNYGDPAFDCGTPLAFSFDMTLCNDRIPAGNFQLRFRGDADGNTGCWNQPSAGTNTVNFSFFVQTAPPLYNPLPGATTAVDCTGPTANYTSTITAGCGNGNSVTWWDAATGGNQVGSGSPFVYDPPGSACPGGQTLYAQCCTNGTLCLTRRPVAIPACPPPIAITNVQTTNGNCTIPSSINGVTVSGGSGTITYTLNPGGASNTTGVFTGLTGTSYTLTATDANGCSASTTVTFTPSSTAAFTPAASTTAASCPGVNNGQIIVTTTPTATYTYVLDGNTAGAITTNTAATFTGVSAGAHIVSVSDGSAPPCTVNLNVTVGSGTALTATASSSNTSCNNSSDGSASATPNQAGNYNFSINSTPVQTLNNVASATFTGLPAGSYIITYTNTGTSCQGTVNVTVNPGGALAANITNTQESCPGAANGAVTVSNPTGTAPHFYTINATPANTTGNVNGQYTGLTGGSYTVTITDFNGCTGTVTTTVGTGPVTPAPTATSPVTYCENAVATPLTATGSNLLWYTTATGGPGFPTAPTPSTATPGTVTYYVSQTVGVCESPRTAIVVNVTAMPAAPGVTSPVTYCQNDAAVQLTATGTNLLWYTAATGGAGVTTAPTPNTAIIASTTYYVSQTVNNCEGPRASIVVNVTAPPAAPGVITPVVYCQGEPAIPLTATGTNLLWYAAATGGPGSATAPTPSTTTVGNTNYYVSQTAGTCESPRAQITVTVNVTPAAPTVTSPVTYCQNATASALTATGTNLLWYTTATGGTGTATAPIPSTATPGSTIYYVSQTTGTCEGSRAAITVDVTALPAAPGVTSPVEYCQNATATPLTATGTNLLWYAAATGGTGSSTSPTPATATAGSTTYYVSQTVNNCEGPRASIVVNVTATPAAPVVTTPVSYCQNATASALTATGTGLLWYTAPTGGTGVAAAPTPSTTTPGTVIYYVSQTINTCEGPRAAISVVVNPLPAATVATVPASCPAATNGQINLSGTTGAAPYSYSINTAPVVTNSTGMFAGLAAGNYVVTITDANNCVGTVNATVTANAALTGTSTVVNTSCNNAADGSITALVPGGSAPISYNINPAGTPGPGTGQFSQLAPGTYTITFTDANGCSGNVTNTVVEGNSLLGSGNTGNASCPGISDGTFSVTPQNGTAPFSFTINATPVNNTGNGSGNYTGLPAGTYTVTFVDALSCSGTVTGTVTANPALTLTATATNTTCNNAQDGTVTAAPANPGTYSINTTPAQTNTTGSFSGLAPGTYTVTYTAATTCTATATATVTAGAALTVAATSTNSSCPAVSDGTVSVTSPIGPGYSYSLNSTPVQTNTTGAFTGLAAGSYAITVTQTATTCTGTANIIVNADPAFTMTTSVINTSCNNSADGSVSASAAGTGAGTGTYTISTTPPITNTTGTFNGLPAGSYTINFTAANGCTATGTATVTAGPPVSISATSTNTSCPTISNGTVTVAAPASAGGYQYTINTAPPVTQSTNTFTAVAAGTYNVSVLQNATQCTGTTTVTVSSDPALTVAATATNTSCNNATNGSITSTSPTPGGTYVISTTPTQLNTTGTFSGLPAATYTITYSLTNGCSAAATATVSAGPALTATAPSVATSCPGVNNGQVTVTGATGTGTINYTINSTPPVTNTTGAFTLLPAGAYTVSFTDNVGCTGTVNTTVTQGAALTSTQTLTNPNCNGIDDGVFAVTPTSGTGPYSYTINAVPVNTTGASTGSFSGLAPGSYTITITDNPSGCQGTQTATLTTNPAITATQSHTDAKCFGSADGTLTITAGGGSGTFTYALLPSTSFQSSNTFTGLAAGNYTVRVRDNLGCTSDVSVNLGQPTQLTATAIKDNDATCDGNDGGITVTGSGGTAPYQYSIDNGSTYQTSGTFANASVGTFNGTIKVKDANNCVATANNITVGQVNNLTLDILAAPDTTICQGATIRLTPTTNAGAGSTYQWTSLTPVVPNSTIDSITSLNTAVHPIDSVTYRLTVNYKTCSITDQVRVNVLWKPKPEAGPSISICRGDSALLTGSVSHISRAIDSIAWRPIDSLSTPNAYTTWADPTQTKYYYFHAITFAATYGCEFNVYDSVKVVVPADVIASAGRDTIAVAGQPHQLLGSGGSSYNWWSPTVSISSPFNQNPFVTLTSDANFYVEVRNSTGCKDTASVFVKIYDGPTYYVPTAFTPNGDGMNDIFRPIPVGIANTQYFKVFNRYGQTMFETNQYLKGWDGTYRGQRQPIGAYTWMIKGVDKNNKTVEMQGTVLIIQ